MLFVYTGNTHFPLPFSVMFSYNFYSVGLNSRANSTRQAEINFTPFRSMIILRSRQKSRRSEQGDNGGSAIYLFLNIIIDFLFRLILKCDLKYF